MSLFFTAVLSSEKTQGEPAAPFTILAQRAYNPEWTTIGEQITLMTQPSLNEMSVLTRFHLAGQALVAYSAGILDLAIGTISALGMVFTAGTNPTINQECARYWYQNQYLFNAPFKNLLASFNPQATLAPALKDTTVAGSDINGIPESQIRLSSLILKLIELGQEFLQSKNPFVRQCLSRLANLAAAILSPATFTLDLAIGLILSILSLITLGHFETLNFYAYNTLQFNIGYFFTAIVCTLNPAFSQDKDCFILT